MKITVPKPPPASFPYIKKTMTSNRSSNTKPEILLRKALRNEGIRRFRLNWKMVKGKPDLCFPTEKIAIFVNGCFWHRCPRCKLPLPKSNAFYWRKKLSRNIQRDKQRESQLRKEGWLVYNFWECSIEKSPQAVAEKIKKLLYKRNPHFCSIPTFVAPRTYR
jgi:DNA mismatch endonuclease (patch repair protein)